MFIRGLTFSLVAYGESESSNRGTPGSIMRGLRDSTRDVLVLTVSWWDLKESECALSPGITNPAPYFQQLTWLFTIVLILTAQREFQESDYSSPPPLYKLNVKLKETSVQNLLLFKHDRRYLLQLIYFIEHILSNWKIKYVDGQNPTMYGESGRRET